MATAQFSTKGQIVIPKAIRDRHAFSDGKTVEVIDTPAGVLLRSAKHDSGSLTVSEAIKRLRSRIKYAGPTLSTADMRESIDAMFRNAPDERF